ncbi:MAG: aspartate aminotransferase family protein [Myxococcaceae bacterium]|nr:aspartate aminotransferase family protein [Myxococcaceae bacterium]
MSVPHKGLAHDEVLQRMKEMRSEDARWKEGKTFSLVYYAGEEISALVKDAYTMFMAENGLSPLAFNSLRRFETEVVAMAADLFHGGTEAAGTMTSGGSESILMAVKTARDWARAERGVTEPEMVLPITVHPAFEKAAHYFGVKAVHAPIGRDFRADVDEMEKRITDRTILVVGSAPAYPHGAIDPIEEIAALAKRRGLLCHVDACVGGFLLPWAKRLGYPIPKWDFEVDGVTSISADLHKYGFAAKGASVLVFRNAALRRHQFFTYGEWPGGLYASPSMTGTRPGGAIAAAWAVMHFLGEEGYLKLARQILDTTRTFREGIAAIPGLRICGEPAMSVFAFEATDFDVYALGDAMEAKGWKLDRQQRPPTLHLMITPAHALIADQFLADLRACAASLQRGEPAPEGSAAMYGMAGAMPAEALDGFLLDFIDGLYGTPA